MIKNLHHLTYIYESRRESLQRWLFISHQKRLGKPIYFLNYAGSRGFLRAPNIGDFLTLYLYQQLSHKKAPPRVPAPNDLDYDNYMAVGSILQFADKRTIVLGTGFHREEAVFGCRNWEEAQEYGLKESAVTPQKICAVRGPLTRKRVLELGVQCPEVFGDPACLMPLFYNPSIKKTKRIGVVPHFTHENSCFSALLSSEDCKLISVYQRPQKFINDLLECEYIVSSSLHGLILADCYGIPSLWVMPEAYSMHRDFKYLDYLASVNSNQSERIIVTPKTTFLDIKSLILSVTKSKINIKLLLKSCPFLDPDLKL